MPSMVLCFVLLQRLQRLLMLCAVLQTKQTTTAGKQLLLTDSLFLPLFAAYQISALSRHLVYLFARDDLLYLLL